MLIREVRNLYLQQGDYLVHDMEALRRGGALRALPRHESRQPDEPFHFSKKEKNLFFRLSKKLEYDCETTDG